MLTLMKTRALAGRRLAQLPTRPLVSLLLLIFFFFLWNFYFQVCMSLLNKFKEEAKVHLTLEHQNKFKLI